jgi:hypothetical protein
MAFLPRTLSRMTRPAAVLALVFAQAVSAFGFPLVQSRWTVKACGCVMPCGSAPDNCCCSRPAPEPEPEPEKPGKCPKCRDRGETARTDAPPKVKWVAGWKARQCRGESQLGLLVEVPAVPPAAGARVPNFAPVVGSLAIVDAEIATQISIPLDPPPRSA